MYAIGNNAYCICYYFHIFLMVVCYHKYCMVLVYKYIVGHNSLIFCIEM